METIKILFVEDHNMVRDGIKLMLTNQNYFKAIIDDARDGVEAINMALMTKYDVILLDINLPKKDGLAVASALKLKDDNVKILALSMHEEQHVVKNMLAAGALGYILKNSGLEELTKAIITVNRGEKYYSNEITQIVLNQTENKENDDNALFNSVKKILTSREIEVLKLIANGLSNKEIAEKFKISHRTVGNHRNNILQKLHINKTAGLVAFAIKNELV